MDAFRVKQAGFIAQGLRFDLYAKAFCMQQGNRQNQRESNGNAANSFDVFMR